MWCRVPFRSQLNGCSCSSLLFTTSWCAIAPQFRLDTRRCALARQHVVLYCLTKMKERRGLAFLNISRSCSTVTASLTASRGHTVLFFALGWHTPSQGRRTLSATQAHTRRHERTIENIKRTLINLFSIASLHSCFCFPICALLATSIFVCVCSCLSSSPPSCLQMPLSCLIYYFFFHLEMGEMEWQSLDEGECESKRERKGNRTTPKNHPVKRTFFFFL